MRLRLFISFRLDLTFSFFSEPIFGCSKFGPYHHAPADYAQNEEKQGANNWYETNEFHKNKTYNNSQNWRKFLTAKGSGKAFSKEKEHDDAAKNFDDYSDKDESDKDRNAYQNKGEEGGKDDKSNKDDQS